jgi:tetratricopeptide (TPR) repeat protein
MDDRSLSTEIGDAARQARELIGAGRPSDARPLLEPIIAGAPDWFAARLEYAGVLLGLGEAKAARAQITAAIRLAGADEQRLFAIAALHHNAGMPAIAKNLMKRCLALCPAYVPALAHYMDMLRRRDAFATALRHADRLVILAPLSAQARAMRVLFLHRTGQHPAVGRAARPALLLDPANASILLYLAIADSHSSDLEAALASARRASIAQPNWDRAQLILTGALFGVGDFTGALAAGRSARSLGADPAETDFWLGRVLLALHDGGAADRHFAAAEQRDPARRHLVKVARLTMNRRDFQKF